MKSIFGILFLSFCVVCKSQHIAEQLKPIEFPAHLKKTNIAKLEKGDSLIFYQCHVDKAKQELTTSSGQKITAKSKHITITDKFVIHKKDSAYTCRYYVSTLTNYPNKKFPYLTLKEVDNWEFELKKNKTLIAQELYLLSAFETKTHAVTHYELNINKSCPNEVIMKGKYVNEQLIVEGNYLLSHILNFN